MKLCVRSSRGSTRTNYGLRDPLSRTSKTIGGGLTQAEIHNLLKYFKTDILSTLNTQLDVLQEKQKQFDAEQALAIFLSSFSK